MEFRVSEQPDKEQPVEIENLSADLKRGLSLCHSVLDEFRLKMAANSHETQPANDVDADEASHG
jgi:hypothetical protein